MTADVITPVTPRWMWGVRITHDTPATRSELISGASEGLAPFLSDYPAHTRSTVYKIIGDVIGANAHLDDTDQWSDVRIRVDFDPAFLTVSYSWKRCSGTVNQPVLDHAKKEDVILVLPGASNAQAGAA